MQRQSLASSWRSIDCWSIVIGGGVYSNFKCATSAQHSRQRSPMIASGVVSKWVLLPLLVYQCYISSLRRVSSNSDLHMLYSRVLCVNTHNFCDSMDCKFLLGIPTSRLKLSLLLPHDAERKQVLMVKGGGSWLSISLVLNVAANSTVWRAPIVPSLL